MRTDLHQLLPQLPCKEPSPPRTTQREQSKLLQLLVTLSHLYQCFLFTRPFLEMGQVSGDARKQILQYNCNQPSLISKLQLPMHYKSFNYQLLFLVYLCGKNSGSKFYAYYGAVKSL